MFLFEGKYSFFFYHKKNLCAEPWPHICYKVAPSVSQSYGCHVCSVYTMGSAVHYKHFTYLSAVKQLTCRNTSVNKGQLLSCWLLNTFPSLQPGLKPAPCTWIVMTPSLNSLNALSLLPCDHIPGRLFSSQTPLNYIPPPSPPTSCWNGWDRLCNKPLPAIGIHLKKQTTTTLTHQQHMVPDKHLKNSENHSVDRIVWNIVPSANMFYLLWLYSPVAIRFSF